MKLKVNMKDFIRKYKGLRSFWRKYEKHYTKMVKETKSKYDNNDKLMGLYSSFSKKKKKL